MNIIVTNNKIEYSGFLKISSLKEVCDVVGNIEFLVYHKSSESQEQKVEYLTKLKDKSNTMVYIRDREYIEQAVQMIVIGSEGKYIDDEFFLESSDELNRLITNLDDVTAIVQLGGTPVLSDFFNRYLKDGSSSFNSSYLAVVKQAVETMLSEYRKKDMELLKMSTTATEIFANSAEIIHRVQSEQQKMRETVSKLESMKESNRFNGTLSTGGLPSVVFFPRVSYMKEKCIIRIKEIGSCPYLTSMMLGFRVYLENIKYSRPKLIFIEPVGSQYETKYRDFNWVVQKSQKSMQGYYNPVVFTNYPSKDVITRLLDDTDYDTFIVVDRLKTSNDHILNSKGNTVKFAVSGRGVVEKFSLNKANCFSMITKVEGSLFTIPVFPDYPEDSAQRERLYLRVCSDCYEMLYNSKRR